MQRSTASHPLTDRYASPEMSRIFSPQFKFQTWRRLWLALAESQKELGLAITAEQIAQIEAHLTDINFEDAEKREREIRHDVMAHIHALGLQAPAAKPILHLGATSAFVTDNTELIQMREGMDLIRKRLVNLIGKTRDFADRWKVTPTVAFTHFQPAQLTTVGKRATLWLQDILLDWRELRVRQDSLPFLGAKGATGTQASFLKLFDGDADKVLQLDALVAKKMGFAKSIPISGQTYTRKIDAEIVAMLSGFAQSASKFGYDLRLLQHLHEIEEPFEEEQVGSSAMAYKRNPMRAERIDGLARHLIINSQNPAHTAATQWFERTLDDSSNRRIAIPEAFLAADAIALLWDNLIGGMVVHESVIAANVRRELPFIATENLMMEGVRRGGDRQVLHERVRVHALAAADALKNGARENDLFERLASDPLIPLESGDIESASRPEDYFGLAPLQVERFLAAEVDPVLAEERRHLTSEIAEVRV